MDAAEISAALRTAAQLRLEGVGPSALRAAVAAGAFVVVRRGCYVDATTWSTWFAEARTIARAIATSRSGLDGAVASSHTDALALHGIPLYRFSPRQAHVTGPATDGGTGRDGVARHRGCIEGETEDIGGIRATTLARTIADVVGRLPLSTAVAATDAALRKVAWRGGPRPYDEPADAAFRAAVRACGSLRPGAAHRVQAEWVLDFADGRAQLPGESVTRVHLWSLGFARPRLQVRVVLPGSGWYDVDFGLDDADAWLEFDGTGKYTDPAWRGGRDAARVVVEEKHREDVLRAVTGRPMLRVGWAHIDTAETLRRRLAVYGVTPSLTAPARLTPARRRSAL